MGDITIEKKPLLVRQLIEAMLIQLIRCSDKISFARHRVIAFRQALALPRQAKLRIRNGGDRLHSARHPMRPLYAQAFLLAPS